MPAMHLEPKAKQPFALVSGWNLRAYPYYCTGEAALNKAYIRSIVVRLQVTRSDSEGPDQSIRDGRRLQALPRRWTEEVNLIED